MKDLYRETLPYTDANGIYYYLDLPREPAHIFCQRRRLFRALDNILLNATAYTPPGGRITLSLLCERDWAVIRVADTGAGISPENLPHIFDYRFSTNNQPPDSGSRGLGLYFARITAEELGGTLTVVSEPGLGTTFSMRLPLQHPSPKTEEL